MKKLNLLKATSLLSLAFIVEPILSHQHHDHVHDHDHDNVVSENPNNIDPTAITIANHDVQAFKDHLDSLENKQEYIENLMHHLTQLIKDKDIASLSLEDRVTIRYYAQNLKYLLPLVEQESWFKKIDINNFLEAKKEPGKVILAIFYYSHHPELVTTSIQNQIDQYLAQDIYLRLSKVKTDYLNTQEDMMLEVQNILKSSTQQA